jgi:hypothetical protein
LFQLAIFAEVTESKEEEQPLISRVTYPQVFGVQPFIASNGCPELDNSEPFDSMTSVSIRALLPDPGVPKAVQFWTNKLFPLLIQ